MHNLEDEVILSQPYDVAIESPCLWCVLKLMESLRGTQRILVFSPSLRLSHSPKAFQAVLAHWLWTPETGERVIRIILGVLALYGLVLKSREFASFQHTSTPRTGRHQELEAIMSYLPPKPTNELMLLEMTCPKAPAAMQRIVVNKICRGIHGALFVLRQTRGRHHLKPRPYTDKQGVPNPLSAPNIPVQSSLLFVSSPS